MSPHLINFDIILRSIKHNCTYNEKISVLNLLFTVATADYYINEEEIKYIFDISQKLNILSEDYNSIKNVFTKKDNNCFKILGITPAATQNEIKTAYRKMVNIYHPDKNIDSIYEKEKFQEIISAYNEIKKIKRIK
jgi:DnaJ like chaperone protein